MASLNDLQNRMKSVRDTRKITNAMYLISSAKMRKARRDMEASRPHFFASQAVIGDILRNLPDIVHPYIGDTMEAPRPGKTAFIVVTGDKGLAGAYNHNVLKLAERFDEAPEDSVIFTVGEVGLHSLQQMGLPVDMEMHYPSQEPNISRARDLSLRLLEQYRDGTLGEVYVVYTSLHRTAAEAVCRRLLPLYRVDFDHFTPPDDGKPPVYLPSPQAILDTVVPNYITGFLFDLLVEAYCAELGARMMAMQSATENADEMLEQLSLEANRARQEAITQEITEIASGARAQKKGGSV